MSKKFITWNEYESLVQQLAMYIENDMLLNKKEYKAIYGVPRGGMAVALILSHILDVKCIETHELELYSVEDVLIVDDIMDSGETLKPYLNNGYDIMTIYKRTNCKYKPKYYADENEDWIVFPYEVDGSKDTVSIVKYGENNE